MLLLARGESERKSDRLSALHSRAHVRSDIHGGPTAETSGVQNLTVGGVALAIEDDSGAFLP
jgi:hypothetical protein